LPIKGDLYGVLEVREKSKRRALPGRLAEIASAKEVRLEAMMHSRSKGAALPSRGLPQLDTFRIEAEECLGPS
jgi:hypothetical protein